MRCSGCGAGIPVGQRVCPRCGGAPAPPANVFEVAERRALLAQGEYLRGVLGESGYRDELYRLVIRDRQGAYWSFVPDVGWHRHDGQRWVKSAPPPESGPPAAPAPIPSSQLPARPKRRGSRRVLLALTAVAAVMLLCVCGAGLAWALYQQQQAAAPPPARAAPPRATAAAGSAIVLATPPAAANDDTMAGLSADQRQVVSTFGWPHAFAIMEIDGPNGGTMRHEQWSYYDAQVSYCFVDGAFVHWEPVTDAPARSCRRPTAPTSSPWA